jgi:hypothetical protein
LAYWEYTDENKKQFLEKGDRVLGGNASRLEGFSTAQIGAFANVWS